MRTPRAQIDGRVYKKLSGYGPTNWGSATLWQSVVAMPVSNFMTLENRGGCPG